MRVLGWIKEFYVDFGNRLSIFIRVLKADTSLVEATTPKSLYLGPPLTCAVQLMPSCASKPISSCSLARWGYLFFFFFWFLFCRRSVTIPFHSAIFFLFFQSNKWMGSRVFFFFYTKKLHVAPLEFPLFFSTFQPNEPKFFTEIL